ncbi:MAG: T9SS type A sorting domain-containing protein [Sphingobacteriales bacterium]|nr:T9SS type A sorting domain-containing protein [Sphingobacteriales bacterium]
MRISDINGRIVETRTLFVTEGVNVFSNFQGLASQSTGMYFIQLSGRDTKQLLKVIHKS